MIRLHYSNRLEQLIAPLAGQVARQQAQKPLDPVVIVVPNRAIEQFVRLRLAEALGVAANLRFPFLRRFLASIVESADPRIKVLDLAEIELALFESIRKALNETGARSPIRDYVEGDGDGSAGARELRAFHLARRVGWLFREYSITRRMMVAGWHRGRLATAAAGERWQRDLWLSIFDQRGCLREEWSADRERRGMLLLPDAIDAVDPAALRQALPGIAHIFGLAYAGPAYAQIFARLGGLAELDIYALNPCLEFWEDVDVPSGIARESWIHRRTRVGSLLETSPDPFGLDTMGDTPALRLWSRPGREYIRLLNEITECDFDPHFIRPTAQTLLSRLQLDILHREPEHTLCETNNSITDDGSIRILACPGIRRECEIVANEIWSLIQNDTTELRFHQIGVLVPDRLYQSYLPHLETIFDRLHQIPASPLNRRYASESRVSEAVMLLLRLPLGRFSRDEMLHLLTHPALNGQSSEIDSARVREWCDELGVFFGASAADLSDSYIPPGTYHWDQALKRLALGVFMNSSDEEFFSASDGIRYLPYSTAEDELPAAAAFARRARSLLADATYIRRQRNTLSDWSQILTGLILRYIRTSTPQDEHVRDMCVAAIDGLAASEINSTPTAYEVTFEMAAAAVADLQSQQGQLSERGVAIGPASSLRAIPFRVVFMMGLNESEFPESTRHDPTDLRLLGRKAGDVTPTERDRYLFLETLGAARDRFYLSYVARDAQTGDVLEPSSAVRELQFVLRQYLDERGLSQLTIEHPVSRYDLRYFPEFRKTAQKGGGRFTSFDPEARHGARMAALRTDLASHCEGLVLPGRDEPLVEKFAPATQARIAVALRSIPLPAKGQGTASAGKISLPLSALRRFLECPLQGAAQYALGITEEDEPGDSYDDEPIAQSILDRSILLRDVFRKARGNARGLEREYDEAVRIAMAKGHAPAGLFADKARDADLARIREWIQQASAAGVAETLLDFRVGRGNEFARADKIVDEITLDLDPSDESRDRRIITLHGQAGLFTPGLGQSIHCVLRDEPRPKDFLAAFLGFLALVAAGEKTDTHFRAVALCGAGAKPTKRVRSLRAPGPREAHAYLSGLAAELLGEPNHYFLPIEAVASILKNRSNGEGDDPIDIIENMRLDEYFHCSSDFGPIRYARRFPPPPRAELTEIIERRFGPIASIFEEWAPK